MVIAWRLPSTNRLGRHPSWSIVPPRDEAAVAAIADDSTAMPSRTPRRSRADRAQRGAGNGGGDVHSAD